MSYQSDINVFAIKFHFLSSGVLFTAKPVTMNLIKLFDNHVCIVIKFVNVLDKLLVLTKITMCVNGYAKLII